MTELVTTIQEVLAEADVVLGWVHSETAGVAVPAWFRSAAEAEAAVFDSTCVHSLAVHLPRLQDRTVGIVAKGCDIRSVVQLISEGRVRRDQVRIISVPCPGVVDVKKVWRCFGYGKKLNDAGGQVEMEGKTAPREEILLWKCRGCRDTAPLISDAVVGDPAGVAPPSPAERTGLRERFDAMTPAGRRRFWQEQFSRCIRCNACREACPLCFCRDVCTMQTREPHWTGGQINAREAEMAQHIRINHLAGRCTGCEECERACPVGIPLMLLLEEQNRAVEELFGFRAGTDPEAAPPLLTFDINNDNWGNER